MPLDENARRLLERMLADGGPPSGDMPVEQARLNSAGRFENTDGPPQPVRLVVNTSCPGPGREIPLRLYYPEDAGPLPVVVFFHGGGWVLCSLDSHDTTCRRLVNVTGCLVVSVDYRLAPEHPFPAAVEDAFAATKWVAEHAGSMCADPARIAVAGDSAGGNLAAVVSLLARDAGAPKLVFQLLIVPVTEHLPDNSSYRDCGADYYLTRDFMAWFFSHYLPREQDRRDWRALPSLAPSLAGLPPALVLTAECDPLREEGEAYARRLAAEGVPVTLRRFDGTLHQFFVMSEALPQGKEAMQLAAAHLKERFFPR